MVAGHKISLSLGWLGNNSFVYSFKTNHKSANQQINQPTNQRINEFMKEIQSYNDNDNVGNNALRLILAVLIICFLMEQGKAQHNNELFIEGQLYVEQGTGVYVLGDIHVDGISAALNNDGTIIIEGNMYKNHTASYLDAGLGQIVFRNKHVNTAETQTIFGDFTGQNALANLTIDNQSPTPILSLADGNIEITKSLQLLNGNLRTDAISHAEGALYANEIYISSTSPNALQISNAAYIEGKLRREIATGNNYTFPIGINTGEAEPFELNFRTAPSNFNILTYFQNHQNAAGNEGTNCGGTTYLSNTITGRWITEPSRPTAYQYDVTLLPSSNLMEAHGTNKNIIAEGGKLAENCPDDTPLTAYNLSDLSYFDIVGISPNLAIELERIWAEKANNEIVIHWTTASETNNMSFELQKSIDATSFERIAWIDGKGNSTSTSNYKYTDTDIQEKIIYYYRLKAIETDGKHQYSPIVSATYEGDFADAQVFPNPIRQNEKLSLIAIRDGQLYINIFDEYARQVHRQTTNALKGEIINMPMPNLTSGIYLVTMTDGSYLRRTKLVVAQ